MNSRTRLRRRLCGTSLRRLLVSAAGVFVLAAGALAFADSSSAPVASSAASLTTGQDVYTHICQGCHMPQGQGATGAGMYPKLAGDKTLVSWQYAAIVVLGGKNGMPPFGLPPDQAAEITTTHLSDQQIADVVNFVRSNFGNRYKDKASAQAVAALPHPGAPAQK